MIFFSKDVGSHPKCRSTEDLSEAHDAMSSLGGFAPKRLNAEPSMRRMYVKPAFPAEHSA